MDTVKKVLSVVALLVGAFGAVLTSGQPVQVSPTTIGMLMSMGGALGILGVSPFLLDAAMVHALQAMSLILTSMVAAHAASVTSVRNEHPWMWAAMGLIAAVAGVLGKSPVSGGARAADPAPASIPPAAAK
ncbi:MAG TPA: hypothetical protein VHG72_14075 [Polyangia bacterium]|nr:hypothetical protein [Polyangia bacterium]